MDRIGLIAGGGNFPTIFAKEAKRKGSKVIAFALKDITPESITKYADRVHWIDVTNFKIQGFIFLLFAERIKRVVMVGKFDKSLVFKLSSGNHDIKEVLQSTQDNTDYSILAEVTKRLGQIGIQVVDVLEYLKDILPQEGVLTKRLPSEAEWQDIRFGAGIAREIAHMDIGQTITVKNKAVVTVEAMEGTDQAIRRAHELVKNEFTVIKMARPRQDMRWDVPLVGYDTVKTMIENGGRVLAMESGKMFFVEREKCLREADDRNVTIVVV